ncbi:hypothetical protein Zmor_012356 [Zophobas morio]|uniref:COP9 signalosome complex subunit 5 n=1 Tax=Zophobas morio TaxID=2755281 RepID=A0AA38LYU1_9CUCU|nr:hypothetical protein Zmor_012356 [Zophobas morio]
MSSDPVVGEYMYFLLVTAAEKLNKKEKLIGWYHSHPGFGCWLSKIDCGTQRCCQRGGMHVAVVVDPHRTLADGRLELGAFRCYPQDYRPPGKTETQEKFLKFGSCAEEYYPLEVAYFNTSFQQKILEEVSLGLQSRAVPCLSYDVVREGGGSYYHVAGSVPWSRNQMTRLMLSAAINIPVIIIGPPTVLYGPVAFK